MLTTAYGEPALLLQRRSRTKDSWPGFLDVAVGGHVSAGETVAEALREAEEEIGLAPTLDDLVRLGRRFSHREIEREVQEVFGMVVDVPLVELTLHPLEVDTVVRLGLADAKRLLVDGEGVNAWELVRGEADERRVMLHAGEVVHACDAYYGAVVEALGDVVAGAPVVPFDLR